jgi:murein DD-endopeptidase MepM/ murein hydrolase activator NlpD
MIRRASFLFAVGLAASLLTTGATGSAHGADYPKFRIPLDCTINVDCWVINYFDHAADDRIVDFTGGDNLYNRHQGIDFAISNMAEMVRGVPVLAVADGKVVDLRDHIPDIGSVTRDGKRIENPMCGNAVLIDHGASLRTLYCHLRRGSISVAVGDEVKAGHPVGLVGLSGFTNFPHVHLAVSIGKDKVDPFVGAGWTPGGDVPARPMWREDVLESLSYQPFVLMDAGFTGSRFSKHGLLSGWFERDTVPPTAHVLSFSTLVYYADPGDLIDMKITDPDGNIIAEETVTLDDGFQRHWRDIRAARPDGGWRTGKYTGTVVVTRPGTDKPYSQTLSRMIEFTQ